MTVLVAGDDGRVRLWKATSGNVWRAAGSVSVEQQPSKQKRSSRNKKMSRWNRRAQIHFHCTIFMSQEMIPGIQNKSL